MESLEDPFDGIGVDDLNIYVLTEPILLMYKPLVKNIRKSDQIRISQFLPDLLQMRKKESLNEETPNLSKSKTS